MFRFWIRYIWISTILLAVIAGFSILFSRIFGWELQSWSSIMTQTATFTILLAIAEHDAKRKE